MSARGTPYRVDGQKLGSQAWHTVDVYSAMTHLGAMQQALADIRASAGFVSLRALPIKRVLRRKL